MPFEELVNQNNMFNKNGKLSVDNKAVTNISGVFAGGDCVNGGKEVVDAVQAGKDGAAEVLKFLFATDALIGTDKNIIAVL